MSALASKLHLRFATAERLDVDRVRALQRYCLKFVGFQEHQFVLGDFTTLNAVLALDRLLCHGVDDQFLDTISGLPANGMALQL